MSNAPHLKVNGSRAHHLLGILSGNPPDSIVQHSASRGQTESFFFYLDLPIKYDPNPKLHGPKWRHKIPTNHLWTDLSQGTRSAQIQTQHSTCWAYISDMYYSVLIQPTHLHSEQTYSISEAVYFVLFFFFKRWFKRWSVCYPDSSGAAPTVTHSARDCLVDRLRSICWSNLVYCTLGGVSVSVFILKNLKIPVPESYLSWSF